MKKQPKNIIMIMKRCCGLLLMIHFYPGEVLRYFHLI